MKPALDAMLQVVKSLDQENRDLVERAEAAEEALDAVKPSMELLEKSAAEARERAEAVEVREMARSIRESHERKRKIAKREQAAELEAAVREVTKNLQDAQPIILKFVYAHQRCVPSLVKYRGQQGPFEVHRESGEWFRTCETRKQALAALDDLIAVERAQDAEILPDDDNPGRPTLGDNAAPAEWATTAGRLDGRKIKRACVSKRARLL